MDHAHGRRNCCGVGCVQNKMTPDPTPTLLERANELDVAAKFAFGKGDYVFAQYLAR